ncbi:MAG TPA: F0F1 ATP synthase subunit epsilon [Hyphomicrobiaceae bacterium]|nr:F0F1 ATP synthase subunit epsilon [Hyphomicrobiaceae bacterium]
MAGTFKFELVSPESILISADAEQVVVPGMEGQFTVFAGHAPVISTLRPGVLDAQVEGARRRVFVRGGFAEVEPQRLTVLVQHLLDLDALDAGQLAHELESAEQMLAEAKDDTTRMVAGEAVEQLKALRP